MIVVTGGAGFIGSVLVWALNQQGKNDIIIVDELDHDEKERNVAPLHYEQLVGITDFRQQIKDDVYKTKKIETIFHLGACSDTTEQNWEYLTDNNIEYSKDVIRWCVDRGVRCLYASSAAIYGDGKQGFGDTHALFEQFIPLNLYGKSKLAVDIWARDSGYLDQAVGLRYFNIFGPNEAHKEHMRSVIAKKFTEVRDTGSIELFKSYNTQYADGEQERDFLYVKDAVAATLSLAENSQASGVFNIGSGSARTWNDVAQAMFTALKQEPRITYVDMPPDLKKQYQYHTEADVTKLRNAGFKNEVTPLEDAIGEYITTYLVPDKHVGEEA